MCWNVLPGFPGETDPLPTACRGLKVGSGSVVGSESLEKSPDGGSAWI